MMSNIGPSSSRLLFISPCTKSKMEKKVAGERYLPFTTRKRSLGQGNVFTHVCLFPRVGGRWVCLQGGLPAPPPELESGRYASLTGMLSCLVMKLYSMDVLRQFENVRLYLVTNMPKFHSTVVYMNSCIKIFRFTLNQVTQKGKL